MTSAEADDISSRVGRIAVARKFVRRAVFVAGALWLLTPLSIGLAISAGASERLWQALLVPALAFFVGLIAWGVVKTLEAREHRRWAIRVAAEELAQNPQPSDL